MKKRERPQRKVIPASISQAMKLVAVGTEFGMSVTIMTLIGYLLFKKLFGEDFAALGVTVGIFIGFFTGAYTLYREFCKKPLK